MPDPTCSCLYARALRVTTGCPLHDPFLRDEPPPNFVGLAPIIEATAPTPRQRVAEAVRSQLRPTLYGQVKRSAGGERPREPQDEQDQSDDG